MQEKKKTKFIHNPEYKGGQKELSKFIYAHLKYPAAALEAGIEGTVLIEYDIDYQGNVITTRVLQGLGYGCDEEAARVIKMLKFQVEKNRGLHVIFHKKTTIHFKKPEIKTAAPAQIQVTYTYTQSQPETKEAPASPTKVYSYSITPNS
jgi:TonB family protein